MIHLDRQSLLPWQTTVMHNPPRKLRAVLLAAFLSIMLLLSQILPNFNRLPQQLPKADFEALESMNVDIELPSCIKSHLGKSKPPAKPPNTCQHLPPPRGFCSLLQDLYFSKHPPKCKTADRISFCNYESGNLTCGIPSRCNGRHIYLGSVLHGSFNWDYVVASLENSMEKAFNSKSSPGFLLITCLNTSDFQALKNSQIDLESDYIQLFYVPSATLQVKNSFALSKSTDLQLTAKKMPNLNLLMVDSLSRNHFYRSLLQTVNFMEKLKESSTVAVLDFEYLQALKHSLTSNLNILFSGGLNFEQDKASIFSHANNLFRKFKQNNYHTLYFADECLKTYFDSSEPMTLGINRTWDSFEKTLKSSGIDALNLSLLSCALKSSLRTNNLTCIHGETFQSHLLRYLYLSQLEFQTSGQPLFTFMQTSIADEGSGIRVQSLDKDLANYLQLTTQLEDTVTIIFSPRGSDYGSLIQRSPEGYVEKSNPFLFVLVPRGAVLLLGASRMHSLRENQQNLVSLLDLHGALVDLIDQSESANEFTVSGGLFGDISPTRTCQDVPIVMPNLCICKNFDIPVEVSKLHHALADFGIGVLNNKILDQRVKKGQNGFGSCQMLRIMRIRRAHEMRVAADIVQHKLEVEVSGILESGKDRELFFLVIESGSVDASLDLVFYQRINLYGSYASCQDEEVDIDICVCDLFSEDDKPLLPLNSYIEFFPKLLSELFFNGDGDAKKNFSLHQIMSFIKFKSDSMNVSLERDVSSLPSCAQVVHHDFGVGFTAFAANLCHYKIKMKLKIKFRNLYLSKKPISSHMVSPLGLKLLVSGIKANVDAKHYWEYKLQLI